MHQHFRGDTIAAGMWRAGCGARAVPVVTCVRGWGLNVSSRCSIFVSVGLVVATTAGLAVLSSAAAQTRPAAVAYELSKEELSLDCRKLTGRIKIRLLQVRSVAVRNPTTDAARNAQSLVTPIMGGTKHGVDPSAELARDRAMIEAYNRRLAEKNCKTVDLETGLQQAPKP
jgi:hypothetical protein